MKTCSRCSDEKPEERFEKGRTVCRDCRGEYKRQKAREWQQANPERAKARVQAWRKANPDQDRSNKLKYERSPHGQESRQAYRTKNGDHLRARKRSWHRNLRMEALNAYSNGDPKCACCGERELDFLALDHINNDGAEHRRRVRKLMYKHLKDEGYPPGIQVLCHNCNVAKGLYGSCPHQRPL